MTVGSTCTWVVFLLLFYLWCNCAIFVPGWVFYVVRCVYVLHQYTRAVNAVRSLSVCLSILIVCMRVCVVRRTHCTHYIRHKERGIWKRRHMCMYDKTQVDWTTDRLNEHVSTRFGHSDNYSSIRSFRLPSLSLSLSLSLPPISSLFLPCVRAWLGCLVLLTTHQRLGLIHVFPSFYREYPSEVPTSSE